MNTTAKIEPTIHRSPLICWKSILGGLFVATLSHLILSALGVGIGGITAASLINQDENSSSVIAGIGIWMGLSMMISLFIGAYYTVRVSRFVTPKVGMGHGFVLASILFVAMAWGAMRGVGNLLSGAASATATAATSVSSLLDNTTVQDSMLKAIGTAALKEPPRAVAEGLALRLLRGDTASAQNYLAYQTGLPIGDTTQRVTTLQEEFDATVKTLSEATAKGVAAAGVSVFVTLLIGLVAALFGGFAAAKANANMPIARVNLDPVFNSEFANA